MMDTKRRYYIDNLRWACIVLLIPYHIAMAWNCWGEDNYIWFHKNQVLSSFITFISPWYMALLFVLAGVSARLALKKKTNRAFIQERVSKLLIPLIAGMCTVVAFMTYYADKFHNGYRGSFFTHYKVFFTKFTELTGYDGGWTPGHLWFLLYLFFISMICLWVIGLQKRYIPEFHLSEINVWGISAFVLLLPFASQILKIGGKSVGLYMLLYLIGYYCIAEESIMDKIVRCRYILFGVFIVSDIADVYLFIWANHASEILNTVTMYITCWFGILTLLGFAKTGFNQNNCVTRYLTRLSFLIYIFHYIWVILTLYYMSKVIDSTILLVVGSVSLSFLMTLLTCEMIKNIPGIRFLFGMAKASD